MKNLLSVSFLILGFLVNNLYAQKFDFTKSNVIYKYIGGDSLEMTIYKPEMPSEIELPAIVFFFGGGWVSGTPAHFQLQTAYLASRGIIAICPDYRTKNNAGTSPFESVKDACSAMRFLKENGTKMGIDTAKIIASGGSAGGHLAACTAILKNVNEESDNLSFSPVPKALILFNPVLDTSKKGYGQNKMEGREFEISPVHHVVSGIPETLIMHGKNDTTVPFENVVRFKHLMHQEGNKCTLVGYKNQKHGFFNFEKKQRYFKKTMQRTESFLENMNVLKGSSWLKQYCRELKKKAKN